MTGFVYSELATRIPCSGSAYSYIYSIYGEFPAWLVGWNMSIRFGGGAAAYASVWANYLNGVLQIVKVSLPILLYDVKIFGKSVSIITIIFLMLCTIINNKG